MNPLRLLRWRRRRPLLPCPVCGDKARNCSGRMTSQCGPERLR